MHLPLLAAALAAMTCGPVLPCPAQTVFDGFRVTLDGVYAATSLSIDASRPRAAMMSDAGSRIARGEADLSAASARLASVRDAYAQGLATYQDGQARLDEMQRQASSSARLAAAMAPSISTLRSELERSAAQLQQQSGVIEQGGRALADGQAQLAAGRRQMEVIRAYPGTSSVTLHGMAARLGVGWGTSFRSRIGPIHVGGAVDFSPGGTGAATVRVPNQPEVRVETGSTFGVSVRAGWVPLPWLLTFANIGAEPQDWGIRRGTSHRQEWVPGLRLGTGIEIAFTPRAMLRMGYDRTFMPEAGFSGAQVQPTRDSFYVGLARRL